MPPQSSQITGANNVPLANPRAFLSKNSAVSQPSRPPPSATISAPPVMLSDMPPMRPAANAYPSGGTDTPSSVASGSSVKKDIRRQMHKHLSSGIALSGANKSGVKRPRARSPSPDGPRTLQPAEKVIVPRSAFAQPGQLKVRTDYVPKSKKMALANGTAGAAASGAAGAATNGGAIGVGKKKDPKAALAQICPRCGERVPWGEMDKHIRIELLDPRWKEQKEKAEEWKKTSNLDINDDVIHQNLSAIKEFRGDIFDLEASDVDLKKKIEEQLQRQAEIEKKAWDGHTATVALVAQKAKQTPMDTDALALHRARGLIPVPNEAPAESAIGTAVVPLRQEYPPQARPAFYAPLAASYGYQR
ncbi:hypothetical protein M427DRAFT_54697 [Gonapodya prolifera JEL478]|uniref:Splicing factor 3A subunit 1 conserved domain-containing protein n=1 Tax=Gonapodya prolifera (strain JEL478) TaxID=1344416 RepID=A0A139ALJ4_GONPJ|nr:hypothetical protein M427DRAFT_54697 [Gonapodya prolifera JEL478]|eukprot:KXS17424.1 hypothetical protein M427DRAFT_54697 [Gonapodya prolifera JEL478]